MNNPKLDKTCKTLITSRVTCHVTRVTCQVCCRWHAAPELPYFVKEYMLDDHKIFAGACADQNRRKKMEDRHICIPNLNNLLQMEVNIFVLDQTIMCAS